MKLMSEHNQCPVYGHRVWELKITKKNNNSSSWRAKDKKKYGQKNIHLFQIAILNYHQWRKAIDGKTSGKN